MAASQADIGYGASFGIEGSTPGTYVAVAEVVSVTPPGASREAVDVTHLNSDNETKEFIAGMAEWGDASITVNYLPSATDALMTAFTAKTDKFQITFPSGVKMRFAGIVTGYEIGEIVVDDKMSATFTVKCSGAATLVAS